MKRIIVKFYFDREIRIIGFLLGFFSWIIGIVNDSWLYFGLSILIAAILFWTQYEVTIDRNKKYYKRALLLLGIRFGKKHQFERIDNCLIVKGKYTDTIMVGPFGIDSNGDMYHAFLNFSGGESLQIGKSKKRTELLEKVNFFRFDHGFDIIETEDKEEFYSNRIRKLRQSNPKKKLGRDLLVVGIVTIILTSSALIVEFRDGYMSYSNLILSFVAFIAIIIGAIKTWKTK